MLESPLDEIIQQSKNHKVTDCITIGTDHTSNLKVVELSGQSDQVWGTLGIHPHDAKSATDEHFQYMENQFTENKRIVGIGECGYDFYYSHSPHETQQKVFRKHLEMAERLKAPMVIHTREAEERTMETLTPFLNSGIQFLFHSFTSNSTLADFGIENDFYFSFNGISTFPKSEDVRETLKRVPIERILVETDSPFLAPKPYRGKTNFPAYVSLVGAFLADFLELPVDEFAKITRDNTQRFFNKLIHEN